MSQSGPPDAVAIQKLLLRTATAAALEQPLALQPGETKETVNQTIVAALNVISRSSRLEAVVAAARPVASRLAVDAIEGEDEEADRRRAEIQALLGALAALHAFDNREVDHTVID
jgi:hypothetical protein